MEALTNISNTHFARSMRATGIKYEKLPARIPKQQPTNSLICHDIQESITFTTGRDFLEWWRWDSIGAACDPRCGGCRCGKCQPGGKEMTCHVMASIKFSKRKEKIRLGQNLLQEQVRPQTPNPLTRRELLSQVAGLYDPSGLVTPAKQKVIPRGQMHKFPS